jgi:cytochrome P450
MSINEQQLERVDVNAAGDDAVFEELATALGQGHPDPYPTFKRLRQEASVHEGDLLQAEFGYCSPILHIGGREIYTVLSYDAACQVLRDGETFSNEIYLESMGLVMGRNILMMDGQEHRDTRKLLQHVFTRPAMEAWRTELVEPIVEQFIDRFEGRKRADLFRELTLSFPVVVLHRILGLPLDDLADFHRWATEMLCIEFNPAVGFTAAQALAEHLSAVVGQRRAQPGDDMISTLLRAEEEGQALSDEDIIGFLRVLLPAGSETTTRASGSLLVALLTHPDQLDLVRRDRSLLPKALEETLRWEGPVPLVYRSCMKDTVIDGVKIPAGAAVNVAIGSANRDETKFSNPDEFDITRTGAASHLAFSYGPHTCIGLHMGRMEATVAVSAVLDHLPGLRADPEQPPEIRGIAFRGPSAIPALWD